MRVEILDQVVAQYHSNPDKGRRWTLKEPFRVRVDGLEICAPQGFWTDFASVPSVIWPIIDPYELGRAPVLHDFLYFAGWRGNRGYCDDAFLAAMEIEKIAWWKRRTAYLAVRMFGGYAWDAYRQNNKKHKLMRGERGYVLPRWGDRAEGDLKWLRG